MLMISSFVLHFPSLFEDLLSALKLSLAAEASNFHIPIVDSTLNKRKAKKIKQDS